jgi:asparagine synthase (glutamine-hydrolysing)
MAAMRHSQPHLQAFELGSYLDLKYYLPGLLQQEDRMSMAWSVESRVPLLDHRIVELAARMPSWLKVRGGWSKAVLRDAMRGTTPDEILDRKDKKGYPVPTSLWFRRELAGYLRSVLVDAPLRSESLVDSRALREAVEQHQSGRADHGGLLWRALNAELWFRGLGRETNRPEVAA